MITLYALEICAGIKCCAINQYIILVLQNGCNIGFEYCAIGLLKSTTILANVSMKWYYWV